MILDMKRFSSFKKNPEVNLQQLSTLFLRSCIKSHDIILGFMSESKEKKSIHNIY